MYNRSVLKPLIFLFFLFFVVIATAAAEDISNYSGCDVCEGAIHYGADETVNILGENGRMLVANLSSMNLKHIRLDMDGVLKNSTDAESLEGYEIIVYGTQHSVIIKSLLDGSLVQVITDYPNVTQEGLVDYWQPGIYIQSSDDNGINLEDPVPLGWEKLSNCIVYAWIMKGGEKDKWEEKLASTICQALGLIR